MPRYAAFLLGINVGGNRKVPMADLKKLMEKMGYENVKTLLASGNVIFDSADKPAKIAKDIEVALEKKFGFTVGVIVRSIKDIETLVKSDPFKSIKVTPATRLYITFLSSPHKSSLKIPYTSPDRDFRILKVTTNEIISVLTVSEDRGTVDAMAVLVKEFGKKITTRNWNTVLKLLM